MENGKPYLSVIIPAYNEAKRLPLTLVDIDKHLSGAGFAYEIVAVDDCSTDNTAEVVKKFIGLVKNLRMVATDPKIKKGNDKGGAVRLGMLEAKGIYRLFMDSDNSTGIDQFNQMIPYLEKGYDVVIGSRTVSGADLERKEPWYKQIAGKSGNLFIQLMVLPGVWDTQCGFKCFSDRAALRVFPLQKINGWGFDVEVLSLAKAMGYKIKEVPVKWVNDPNSKVKLSSYIRVLIEVMKVRLWLWGGVYGPLKTPRATSSSENINDKNKLKNK